MQVFRALQNRNFKLFVAGQGLSLIGTWIQQVATGWLVYRLTGSAFLLGIVGFSGQIAAFILGPFAGVFVDRLDQRRILLITQTLFMMQAFALSALVISGTVQIWHIIFLSVVNGIVTGFDTPTRQAFIIEMIDDKEHLANAIAINSSMFNGARLVGPAVAGILIVTVGDGVCFLINGISYIAVIVALTAIHVTTVQPEESPANIIADLKEGFIYVYECPPVFWIIILLATISLVCTPYTILMPVFATKVLNGGAGLLGFLTAANGCGALVGATLLASRKSVIGLGKWIWIAAVIVGAGMIGFSLSRTLWISLLSLAIIGFGMITHMASCNTILQTIVPNRVRGRVMSFYTMAFLGMTPFGSLLGGALAARVGSPETVMVGGVSSLIGALAFAVGSPTLRPIVQDIYCRKGILPAALCGLSNVSESNVPPEYH